MSVHLMRRGAIARSLVSYSAQVLADNPVAYWHLDESSGTTAADAMNAHAGTYVNTPTLGASGVYSGETAVTFTAASSQYVNTGNLALFGAGDCTYEAWFKTSTTGATQIIVGEGKNTAANNQYGALYVNTANKVLAQAANDGGTTYSVTSASTVTNGAWHHAALTKAGTTLTLYLDGVSTGTPATLAGTWTLDGSRIAAFLQANTTTNFFNGTIDEVAVYSSALSAARISAHYNASLA